MKINRVQILDTLNKVKAGVSNKGIVEEASCFTFTGKHVVSFNDRISIAMPFESDFTCTVPADELIKTVQNSKAEELFIRIKESEVILSDKKFKAGITTITNSLADSFPINNIEELKWKSCPDNLMQAIEQCLFSAAKSSAVPYLNCIAIKTDHVVSSDNFRISYFQLSKEMSGEYLLPLSSAIELVSINNFVRYAVNNSWMYFRTKEDIFFFCRLVSSEFPDVSALLEVDKKAAKITLPTKELQQALQACSVFSSSIDIDKKVEIEICEGQLSCRSLNDKGWIEYAVDKNDSPDMKFEIHPDFLASILPMINEVRIDEGKLHLHTENFKHVVALC